MTDAPLQIKEATIDHQEVGMKRLAATIASLSLMASLSARAEEEVVSGSNALPMPEEQAAEVITHLAFYVGWPNAFSALPVAKEVFEKRPR
jgi:alkylhydroperoxidase/carboxymuconolactone decarboxylase family protein YurZ